MTNVLFPFCFWPAIILCVNFSYLLPLTQTHFLVDFPVRGGALRQGLLYSRLTWNHLVKAVLEILIQSPPPECCKISMHYQTWP